MSALFIRTSKIFGALMSAIVVCALAISPTGLADPPDLTPPVVTITSPAANASLNTAPQVAFTVTDASPTTKTCQLDGGTAAACSSPFATSGLSQGTHSVTVTATDLAGNSAAAAVNFTFDTIPPDTTITSGPAYGSTITVNSAQFAFTATEAGSTFRCSFDSSPWANCTSPATMSSLANGQHQILVKAVDAAGNTDPTQAARLFYVATSAAPDTTITSGPAYGSTINVNSAAFTFTSTPAGATFQCSFDSSPWSTCTSPATMSSLSDGQHQILVRAKNAQNVVDPTPASRLFYVAAASTPPDTTITSGPAGGSTVATNTVQFGFTSTPSGATFECSYDSAPWAACTSPTTMGSLAEGTHQIMVRAKNAANAVDASPAGRQFYVDTVPPVVTISAPTQGASIASHSVPVSFQVTGATSVTCSLDGAAPAACTSVLQLSNVADGAHTVVVVASDAVGNSASAARAFTVDTVNPAVTITQPATGTSMATSPTTAVFSVVDATATTTTCQVDLETAAACASPFTLPTLVIGQHSVTVVATDAAGNQGSAVTSFEIADPSLASSQVSIDGQVLTFQAAAGVDASAGEANDVTVNIDGASATVNDTEHHLAAGPGCTQQDATTVSCTRSAFDQTNFETEDGGDFVTLNTPAGMINQVNGGTGSDTIIGGDGDDTSFYGSGSDEFAGGEGIDAFSAASTSSALNITLDNTANDGTPLERDNIHEDVETVLGGSGDDRIIGSEQANTIASGNGDDLIRGGGGDDVLGGGAGSDSINGGKGADLMTPDAGANDELDYSGSTDNLTIHNGDGLWSGKDEGLEGDIALAAFDTVATGSGFDLIYGSDDGERIESGAGQDLIYARGGADVIDARDGFEDAVDCGAHGDQATADVVEAGNFQSCESVDSTYSVQLTSGPAEGAVVGTANPIFEFTSTTASVECRADFGDWLGCASPHQFGPLEDGSHVIEIRPTNDSGSLSLYRTFTVDTAVPTVSINDAPQGSIATGSTSIGFAANEPASFTCAVGGGASAACSSPFALNGLAAGLHTVRISATDTAGNVGSATTTFGVESGVANTYLSGTELHITLPSNSAAILTGAKLNGALRLSSGSGVLIPGTGCIRVSSSGVDCDLAGVSALVVQGGSQNDSIVLSDNVRVSAQIDGGGADDTIHGGGSADAITGGGGADRINGGFGEDSIDGGAGNDVVTSADGSPDTVECGSDDDSATSDALDGVTGCETQSQASVVAAAASSSTTDVSFTAASGQANDIDVAASTRHADLTDAANSVLPGDGCRSVTSHKVRCFGSSIAAIRLALGDGNDKTSNSAPSSITSEIHGEGGNDQLTGGSAVDWIDGGSGNDVIASGGGQDTMSGGADDDRLLSSYATEYFYGDAGNDTVDYSDRWSAVAASLGSSFGNGSGTEGDLFESIEGVIGGIGDDQLLGDGGANVITGGPGEDTIDAGDGADTINALDYQPDDVTCGAATDTAHLDALDSPTGCETTDVASGVLFYSGVEDGASINQDAITFEFNFAGTNSLFECSVDGAGFNACTSPLSLTSLADGAHSLEIRGLDAANAVVGSSAHVDYTVDTRAPDLQIASGPADNDVLADDQPTFTFTSSDSNATFECAIDDQPYRACATPFQRGYKSGSHVVSARATDAAANRSGVETRRFTVLPSLGVVFDSSPADGAHVAGGSAVIGFHVQPDELGSATQCAVDGGDFTSCASPFTLASENSGARTVAVRAIDAAGRAGAPEVRTVIFDNGKPFVDEVRPQTLLYDGPQDDAIVVESPTIEFGANEQATFVCRTDTADWAACESPWTPAGLDPGHHKYEVAAIDANGNFTDAPAQGSFELDPGYRPESVNHAIAVLDTAFPAVLQDEPAIETPGGALTPSLSPDVADDMNEFASAEALVESTVATNAEDGFSVDTTDGSIGIVPVDTDSSRTSSFNVNDQTAIAGNVFDGASAFAKPTLTGISFGALMDSLTTSKSFSWELNVGPEIELSVLPNGSVVATRELAPSDDDAEQAAASLPAPVDTSGSGSGAYAAAVDALDAAQDATNDSTLLLIEAPSATDALGNTVPAAFTVDNATKRLTLTVNGAGAGASGPVLVKASGTPNSVSRKPKARAKAVFFGMSGGRDMFGALVPNLNALMERMGKVAGKGNAKNKTFRILVPYDSGDIETQPCMNPAGEVYSGDLATVNGAVLSESGGNPYKVNSRCADLWDVERKVVEIRAWAADPAHPGANIYLSPQPVHSSEALCDSPAPPDAAARYRFPCSVNTFKDAFNRLYVKLQGFANDHGGPIKFWSSFNEPDVFRWHGDDSARNAYDAAETWAVVQRAVRGEAGLAACGSCLAVAGEFGRTPLQSKPAVRKKDLRYLYRTHLIQLVNQSKTDNVTFPKYWSYHNYKDMAYPGNRKYKDKNIANEGRDHGTAAFDYVKGISALTGDGRLHKPGVLMTEGGMNLQGATQISGNDDSTHAENKRTVKIPLAVNRFYYQINSGKSGHGAYAPGKDDLKYFKKIRGVLLYQLATGDGPGFDSSLFENPAQACSDWHVPTPAGCTSDPPAPPAAAPRPAYCALLGFKASSSEGICTGDNRPSFPNAKATTAGKADISATRGTYSHPELMETRIALKMADFDLPDEYSYELSVSFEVCSRSLYPDPDGFDNPFCSRPEFCVSTSCLTNGIHQNSSTMTDALRYTIPAGTDYSAIVPSSVSAEVPISYRSDPCEEDPRYRHVITPIFELRIVGGDPFAEFNPSIPGPQDPSIDDVGSVDVPSVSVRGVADTGLYPGSWCS
ncbi:MAG: hypothetical protein WAO61_01515 [Solirubrobacterales bacterium]